MTRVEAGAVLEMHLRGLNIEYEREYRFHETRRWRFDFAFPQYKIALEIEGLGPRGSVGAHQRTKGFKKDLEKYDAAARLGWNVYRCSTEMARSGHAALTIEEMCRHEWHKIVG